MYQICVSGASKGKSVEAGRLLAHAMGKAIAKSGHMLITGATIGLPNYAAMGAKEAGGMSVGISPAATKVEHVRKYRLPTDAYDVILYSGMHYVGRDTLLIASCDAVITIGGRLGTLHEFTIAMEMEKPIGLLQGAGGVSTEIIDILHAAGRSEDDDDIIIDTDPNRLLERLLARLKHLDRDYRDIYSQEVAKRPTKR